MHVYDVFFYYVDGSKLLQNAHHKTSPFSFSGIDV